MTQLATFLPLLNKAVPADTPALLTANEHKEAWQACLDRLDYVAVGYALPHVAYQHEYFSAQNADYGRFDCVIAWQENPVGVWPLSWMRNTEGQARFSSHINGTSGISPPMLVAGLSEKQHKAIAHAWLETVATLCQHFAVSGVELTLPHTESKLPYWYRLAMSLGASISCRHQLIADLTLPEKDYHRHLRKSYKALVNAARILWHVEVDTLGDIDAFAEFRALHRFVAGKETRRPETWGKQFEAIASGDAYAVYLRDDTRRMVGASLFNCSRDEALYAVGAYDRNLFDKPLAHLSLYESICFARSRGLKRFVLGQRPFPADVLGPSEKEENIAFFKEGFATELQLMPIVRLSASQISSLVAASP